MTTFLTKDEYVNLWRLLFPLSYTDPLETEDEGQGADMVHAYGAIFAEVDEATKVTTSAYYLKPHSTQQAPPASLASKSTGGVQLNRVGPSQFALKLEAGRQLQAREQNSLGDIVDLDVVVTTTEVNFLAGEVLPRGPSLDGGATPGAILDPVPCESLLEGHDQNFPPGYITSFVELGRATIPEADAPDVFLLQSVPQADSQDTFNVGMIGRFCRVLNSADPTDADPRLIVGFSGTGNPADVNTLIIDPPLSASGLTGLRVEIEEYADVGITVSQPSAFENGAFGWLEEIGRERDTGLVPGETQEAFRTRLCNLADTVAPAALVRICERIMSPIGVECVIYEVGRVNSIGALQGLPGFIYDDFGDLGDDAAAAKLSAYDLDQSGIPGLKPIDGVYLSNAASKRFFVACVGRSGAGDFGLMYDDAPGTFGSTNAYDMGESGSTIPGVGAYDGFPAVFESKVLELVRAFNQARGGGIGFAVLVDPTL